MPGKSQGVQVEIYDHVYYLRSGPDADYTQQLAKSVDATMRTIAEKTHTYDSLRLAILAALHFADECEQLRQRHAKLKEFVSEKSLQFSEALDGAAKKEA